MINAVDTDSPVHNGELNFGTMRPLIEPLTTTFGEMRRESKYLFGCKLNFPLDVREEMVQVALVEEDGTEKIVDIGRTPEGFDPAREHMVAQAAGDVGEYLMIMQTPGNRPSIRYLDRVDLDQVLIVKGHPIIFNPNSERGERQLRPSGLVKSVTGYRVNPTSPV